MLAGLVLVALVVSAAVALPLKRTGALLLAAVSVLWFLVNSPMEGDVLVVVMPGHGLTAGDLAGVAGLLVAVAGWLLADG
ncbi:hypothetical protein [Nocardioides sp. LS1]|uniref:hypothetical protein n=1 Tax=Nocardioides sp. LS1 TaxID=1027620 RepID=UPI000F61A9CE|nr:hypothetical protein [Nocardioides sp. LS1]GCD90669.1 hypothetical protein NLS1_26750 [Nocardioides sp. LS1]